MSDPTPLEVLEQAVQQFINALSDEARIVQGAVLVYETVRLDEAGTSHHGIDYASLSSSMAADAGLLTVGLDRVLTDLRGARRGEPRADEDP